MRLYFLVEGRRTESKLYASWLPHLIPELVRISRHDDPSPNSYFLLSAEGFPSIIYDLIPDSLEDINRVGNYDYLVVCLDADEASVQERIDEVNNFLASGRLNLHNAVLKVIVQNRCTETWFLGNRRIVSRYPTNLALQDYLRFYDVRLNDPELMSCHPDFGTHAQFHFQYLREIFAEKNIRYSKRHPGHVLEKTYLEQLLARVRDVPTDLRSFQVFARFCQHVRDEIAGGR